MIFALKRFGFLALCLVFVTEYVQARLVFTNEDPLWDGSTFTIDTGDEATNVDLKFGNSLTARIRFDTVADVFTFNRSINLDGNEVQNVRLENLASAPTCDGTAVGRIYFNTTDNHTYSCDGTSWNKLEDITVNSTEQTADYNTLEEGTVNVMSDTSTNRPTDHQYIVKTLGNTVLKTQVATRTTGNSQRYYRYLQTGVWADWRQIRTKKYGGYSIEDIDQTDGTVSYIGRTRDSDSKWLITKSESGGFTYAQEENNGGTTDYATAWTNRLTLTYGATFSP